ncbi:hypothetical protein LEP1GSC188_4252 [Leptospira weilii serovar Topaz str. LT2116]|uniref:Uncharacterized protein n=1 Tax=Leptospira weilii serovar Topaz str. LT2116 TaxID=1088540 RepID=M3H435_9LEPT|nr:hypothetical protein LEP1GSC188_4252 [Leptospira weilii serovar Topaz str. LT2116]
MPQNHSILSESPWIAAIVPTFWDRHLLKKFHSRNERNCFSYPF